MVANIYLLLLSLNIHLFFLKCKKKIVRGLLLIWNLYEDHNWGFDETENNFIWHQFENNECRGLLQVECEMDFQKWFLKLSTILVDGTDGDRSVNFEAFRTLDSIRVIILFFVHFFETQIWFGVKLPASLLAILWYFRLFGVLSKNTNSGWAGFQSVDVAFSLAFYTFD